MPTSAKSPGVRLCFWFFIPVEKPRTKSDPLAYLTPWPTDLAGIRDAAALANLPADEQKAFTQLWAGVAALLKKAGR